MNRSKFRVWCKNRNEWESDPCWLSDDGQLYHFRHSFMPLKPDGHIVVFCTGLKDKNGKLIYESDILQSRSEIRTILDNRLTGKVAVTNYEVRWEVEEGRWGRYRKERFELLTGLKQEFMTKWYKIIGNIYENPELLEEKP